MNTPPSFDLPGIIAHAKSYSFIFPSSEIYDGLQAVYDYGPHGVLLKKNIQSFWWKSLTQLRRDVVGLDASILMHPTTWKASGHLADFHDWFVDNKDSKKRYRVDHLFEEQGAALSESKKKMLIQRMGDLMEKSDGPALTELLIESNIRCPIAQNTHWATARKVNLMFATQAGAIQGATQEIYLRPETAQGIFVNFLNVQKTTGKKLPFGIAQIGKAFRNELIARQFIFRMREFEQMEMQFFIPPQEEEKWFRQWRDIRLSWYHALGIPQQKLRIHPHEQLAHYASAAVDIEYQFPFGFKEVEGIHARTDFDLKSHQRHSGKKFSYFDPWTNTAYIPYVVETSAGCDRLFLMLLSHALTQEKMPSGNDRTYLRLPAALAPFKAAILPLLKKEPLIQKSIDLFDQLKYHFQLTYEERGSIGKRYARQDLIGTPYCITIDHQTLEDHTVTLRDRDTTTQLRLPIPKIQDYLDRKVGMETLLKVIN